MSSVRSILEEQTLCTSRSRVLIVLCCLPLEIIGFPPQLPRGQLTQVERSHVEIFAYPLCSLEGIYMCMYVCVSTVHTFVVVLFFFVFVISFKPLTIQGSKCDHSPLTFTHRPSQPQSALWPYSWAPQWCWWQTSLDQEFNRRPSSHKLTSLIHFFPHISLQQKECHINTV